jgi:hypothetical protein
MENRKSEVNFCYFSIKIYMSYAQNIQKKGKKSNIVEASTVGTV